MKQKLRFYISLATAALLIFPNLSAKALDFQNIAPVTYSATTLYTSSTLTLTATPLSYDPNSGNWDYQIGWNRKKGYTGSVYIAGYLVASPTTGEGSAETGYYLQPNTAYLVTFYSSANGKGSKIYNKNFITLDLATALGSSSNSDNSTGEFSFLSPTDIAAWMSTSTRPTITPTPTPTPSTTPSPTPTATPTPTPTPSPSPTTTPTPTPTY